MTALKKSANHWHELMLCRTFAEVYTIGVGSDTCKLCDEFLEGNCIGCPVRKKTGSASCLGTPYYEAHEYYMEGFVNPQNFSQLHWYALARREYEFLRNLEREN